MAQRGDSTDNVMTTYLTPHFIHPPVDFKLHMLVPRHHTAACAWK